MKRIILDEISLEELTQAIRKIVRAEIEASKELRYISRTEAMEMLSVSHPTFKKIIDAGLLIGRPFGSRMKYLKYEVEEFMQNKINRIQSNGY